MLSISLLFLVHVLIFYFYSKTNDNGLVSIMDVDLIYFSARRLSFNSLHLIYIRNEPNQKLM